MSLTQDTKEEYYSERFDGKDIYLKPKETGSDGGSSVASYDRLEIKGRNSSYTVWSVPLVYGYETAEATIAAATGTATYTGQSRLSLQMPTSREWRKLDANLSVDFNNNTVGGSMKISEAADHTKLTAGTLTLPTTTMSSTGFAASNAQITINQSIDTAKTTITQYALNTIDGSRNTTSINVVINGAYVTQD